MANQEQNPQQQEQPFVAAKQVGFKLKDIILNTNNKVALLYPEHNNKDYFKCVSNFMSKCCLRKPFTRSPNMYKEYLPEFWYSAKALENSKVSFSTRTGGIFREEGVNTFRNAIGTHYLPHSSEYVAPPSSDVVSLANGINIDYANIFWEDIIIKLKKKQREKVVPYTRFLSLLIMHKMKEGYGDDEPGAQTRHKKPLTSSKQPSVSSKEATKGGSSKAPTSSKTGLSKKRKESSSAMYSNPSQPPVSTPVDTGMHKQDQQATGGPTSLGVTRIDALASSKVEADPGNSAPNDFVPQQQVMNEGTKNTSYDHLFAGTDPHVLADQTKSVSEGLETVLTQPITGKGANSIASQIEEETSSTIKLEDLAKLVLHVQPSFKDLDSPEDDLVIVVDDSDEDEDDEVHATENVLILQSQMHKLEAKKNKAKAEAALLKAQSTFPNMERLNELLSLTPQVAELKILQWELPAEFLVVPSQVEMVQAKLKTLDALLSLLSKVTNALNQFAQAITSKKTGDDSVPSAGQAGTQLVEGENNINQATFS
ncbi:hypothetical protein Tco_1135559 [Tanacetum coccineum]